MHHHRLKLELSISFSSRWHFGSGEGSFLANRLLARDSRGRPFIPGSTLKGVIRESCEKLSRTLKFPHPADPHHTDPRFAYKPLDEVLSPVDRLFGNKYEEGGLFFRNAFPVKGSVHAVFNQSRIQMHRQIGTAKSGHLFTSEYGMPVTAGPARPCIEFRTDIDGYHRNLAWLEEDDPPYAYCLLLAAIRLVSRIGGDKSTGSGYLTDNITAKSMVYNGRDIVVNKYLEETAPYYLDPGDYVEVRSS